jgi:hypothetical protein
LNLKCIIFFCFISAFVSTTHANTGETTFRFRFTIPRGPTVTGDQSINCEDWALLRSFDQELRDQALFVNKGPETMNGNEAGYYLCPEAIIEYDGTIYHSIRMKIMQPLLSLIASFKFVSECHYQSNDIHQIKEKTCFVPRLLIDEKTGNISLR